MKNNRVLTVIAEDFIQDEYIETVLPFYRELVEETLKELGCISYELFQDQKDSGHFIFVEKWIDEAALDRHCETEHFKRLVPLINQYQKGEERFLRLNSFE